MEGLYNFYADHGVRYTSHAFNTSCQDFEVTDALIGVETIRLLDSNIDNWLRTQDGSSGLHMVWVPLLKDTMPWRYEIRESTFDAISKHFHVEKALRYGSTAAAGFANFRTGNVTSYSAFLSDLLVFAWSFDASTGTTRGICLGDPWIISTAQNLLPYQSALIGHPMAVGYMVIIILGTLMDRDLLRENRNIAEVENRTGYHGWKKSFAGVAKGEYATLSARMSGCATSLAGQQRIAKVSREALAFVSTISSEHHMNGYSQFLQERISLSAKTMKDFDTILGTRLDVQESQLEFLKQRTQIQLTAVRYLSPIDFLYTLQNLKFASKFGEILKYLHAITDKVVALQSDCSKRCKAQHRNRKRLKNSCISKQARLILYEDSGRCHCRIPASYLCGFIIRHASAQLECKSRLAGNKRPVLDLLGCDRTVDYHDTRYLANMDSSSVVASSSPGSQG